MATHLTNSRDRLILAKYLLEAHGKEQQLETALQGQIALAERPGLERALTDHLHVTRDQIDAIEARLGELGHDVSTNPAIAVAESAIAVAGTIANKGLALAKVPLQALRGTSPADNELRTLRDCYWNEAEEIAHYRVIEQVAEQVGDRETAELARRHRAEEEEMQRTLEGLLPGTVREVIETESPDPQRDASSTSSSATSAPSTSGRATTKPTPSSAPESLQAKTTARKETDTIVTPARNPSPKSSGTKAAAAKPKAAASASASAKPKAAASASASAKPKAAAGAKPKASAAAPKPKAAPTPTEMAIAAAPKTKAAAKAKAAAPKAKAAPKPKAAAKPASDAPLTRSELDDLALEATAEQREHKAPTSPKARAAVGETVPVPPEPATTS